MVCLDKICILIHFNIGTDMLNGDEASPSISLAGFLSFNENAHAKDEHTCDKNSPCFKRSYSLFRHILV